MMSDERGLGVPAGPELRWSGYTTPAPAPAATVPPPAAPDARPPVGRRGRLAGVLLVAALVGGVSGAGAVAVLDQGGAAGPAIVQERTSGRAPAPAGTIEAAARQILPSVVQVRTNRGSGSGVVIDDEGHVLTNQHVVSGAGDVQLVLSTGRRVSADVIGGDADVDIAVLRADPAALRPARLGVSDDLRIGQSVIAVGSPLGLNGTVTAGVISALDRREMIQTDASINPGNSGGPLVDLQGRVVGINTSIATLGGRVSGNIGIGFAVPIDRAADVARQLIARG